MTNLPTLTGTEKQIAWATQIREKILGFVAENEIFFTKHFELQLEQSKNTPKHDRWEREFQEDKKSYAELRAINSAAFWIDNRNELEGAFSISVATPNGPTKNILTVDACPRAMNKFLYSFFSNGRHRDDRHLFSFEP